MQSSESTKVWRNWGRNLEVRPSESHFPREVQEVQDIVFRARARGQKLRVVGSSHSFSAVARPDEVMVSLDAISGTLHVDEAAREVKVAAGTPLHMLGPALRNYGLALANMGDVHDQTLAGAVSTGTHGTGLTLGSLSDSVVAWEFVDGKGELRSHRRGEDDLSQALHLSMGLLGVFVSLTLKVVPIYGLLERSQLMNFQEGLDQFMECTRSVRHMEWFLFPGTNRLQQKTLEKVSPQPLSARQRWLDRLEGAIMLNGVFYLVSELVRFFPAQARRVSGWTSRFIPNTSRRGFSYEIFPKPRGVRFVESEYFVPLGHYEEVLTRCNRELMDDTRFSHFPIEVRSQPGESGFLSPTQGQDSLVLSFHVYSGVSGERLFPWVKSTMAEYEGRPHWGKVDLLSYEELRALYPKLDRFMAVRKSCDPDRVFMTSHFESRLLDPKMR